MNKYIKKTGLLFFSFSSRSKPADRLYKALTKGSTTSIFFYYKEKKLAPRFKQPRSSSTKSTKVAKLPAPLPSYAPKSNRRISRPLTAQQQYFLRYRRSLRAAPALIHTCLRLRGLHALDQPAGAAKPTSLSAAVAIRRLKFRNVAECGFLLPAVAAVFSGVLGLYRGLRRPSFMLAHSIA